MGCFSKAAFGDMTVFGRNIKADAFTLKHLTGDKGCTTP